MSLAWTLSLLGLALGALAFALWRERRPRRDWPPPLVSPWLLQFLALTAALLMLAHLVTLLTGQPFAGRLG
jgi:hypothetical protein